MKSLSRSFMSTLLSIGLIALFVQGAFAHTYLSSLTVNGAALAEGDCVRPHPASGYDNPITLVSSPNMTCGFLPEASEPANRKCPIAAGATMGVQWHHNNDQAGDDILDPSHKGPIIFYLAKSTDGAGAVWFKIWEDGYDSTTGLWATDRMIAAGGKNTFTIPADIASGNYLLRAELLALHNAYSVDGVQPYVGCAELTITGSGNANPAGVAFPGAYKDTDPGLLINIYTTFPLPYVIPGPAVYVAGSSSSSPATSAPTTKPSNPSTPAPTPKPSNPSTPAPTPKPSNPSTPAPTPKPSNPSTPAPTPKPSNPSTPAPTPVPSHPIAGSITVQMNGGSSTWWLGVIVSGGTQPVAKVEIMDSGSVNSWTQLDAQSYAYVFSKSIQLTLPISLRLTSASGAQVTLTNIFTSWTATTPINTGKDYGTAAPHDVTDAPVSNPSGGSSPSGAGAAPSGGAPSGAAPSGAAASVTVYTSSNAWWFAVTVQGVDNIASVTVSDAASLSNAYMTSNEWGYSLPSQGEPFVAPLTVRVTNEAGQTVTATVLTINPGDIIAAL